MDLEYDECIVYLPAQNCFHAVCSLTIYGYFFKIENVLTLAYSCLCKLRNLDSQVRLNYTLSVHF